MIPMSCKGWRVQVTTTERRIFEGAFIACDGAGNLLLRDAEEHCLGRAPRHLGVLGLRGATVLSYTVLSHI